ncbi:phosphoglycerate dehydrogenase [Dactylosporangium sp. NBC_01737]|uniref:phosphoglycerate dehydrogenase n=1 Tax=Dactylosporangium sp. NBC_01737 TaxID=2975959 RepID=UPI002E11AF0B|nr:phosphoglycerate dehydrogenase [Dactylosporangium sp. NBC_01737]
MQSLTSQSVPVRVLFLENIHPVAVERMRSEGYVVETLGRALDEDELIARLDGVHLLGIRSKTQVSAAALAAAPHLRAIGAFCIGTDQIDLRAAAESGIAVFNAPFSNTRSVVELAVAEIIALTRRLTEKNTGMHAGVWDKDAEGSHEVRGRSIGIVGYGNIGTQLSVLAENLGLKVYFYDTADKLALGNASRCDSLDELLEKSDIVTLHVDGRPGNSGFFGEEQFGRMRPRSIFLNLSRGFVIDHEALRKYLENGHLAGAAVDVFPKEPKAKGDEFTSALRGLPNVILTPHIGGSTEEAQSDIGSFVAEKLHKYVQEGSTTLSVNLPSLNLQQAPETHRIALLHHNVPGVLADVNSILAGHKVNVEGQILATRGELGYLLTDIAIDYPAEILAQLSNMATTVQLRVLS